MASSVPLSLADIFLLGNKSDLENQVSEEKAEKFATEHNTSGKYRVSAKTGTVGRGLRLLAGLFLSSLVVVVVVVVLFSLQAPSEF